MSSRLGISEAQEQPYLNTVAATDGKHDKCLFKICCDRFVLYGYRQSYYTGMALYHNSLVALATAEPEGLPLSKMSTKSSYRSYWDRYLRCLHSVVGVCVCSVLFRFLCVPVSFLETWRSKYAKLFWLLFCVGVKLGLSY